MATAPTVVGTAAATATAHDTSVDDTGAATAEDIAPMMEDLVRSMAPSWDTPDGVSAEGSESIYIGGATPTGETSNVDYAMHQRLPDCLRPLPILPAIIAAGNSEKKTVTQYVNARGPDGTLQVNITNVATPTVATSLGAPADGG